MKYKLQYRSALVKAYHSFLFYLCFALIDLLVIVVINVLFMVSAFWVAGYIAITEQNIFDGAYFVFTIEIFISFFIAFKCNKRYVKVDSQGVLIHNSNTEHYGLRQCNRLNVIVPFNRIVRCYKEIPVDCPNNYTYKKYNRFGANEIYFDYIRKVGVMKAKEPAISGGRYDKECILLELDNKHIIVIPIDECEEFLELFNQYIEKYKELKKTKEIES